MRRAATDARSAGATPATRARTAPWSPSHRTSSDSSSSAALPTDRTASCSATGSADRPTAVTLREGSGWSRTITSTMSPRVPNAPENSFARSYPATFLMTLLPARASVPSASATRIPSTRSRGAPYRCLRGPESAVATTPPMVAPPWSGGSRASICPAAANAYAVAQPVRPPPMMTTSDPFDPR